MAHMMSEFLGAAETPSCRQAVMVQRPGGYGSVLRVAVQELKLSYHSMDLW